MSLARSKAIFRNEFRLLRHDPYILLVLTVMPLLLMAFVKPVFREVFAVRGYTGANGAEQAVPGMAVMYAFFLIAFVGLTFFREHGWSTWDRLRSNGASAGDLVAGKCLPIFLMALMQQLTLLLAGKLIFGLELRGGVLAYVLLSVAVSIVVVAVGLAVVAIAKTIQVVNYFQSVGVMLLAGLGGALTPTWLMPGWAKAVAPLTPTYWAVRGYRNVALEGAGVLATLRPVGVLVAFSAAFVAFSLWRFRADEVKMHFA